MSPMSADVYIENLPTSANRLRHLRTTTIRCPRLEEPELPRADAGQMLQTVTHDLTAEAMALDIEQPGGVGLIAAG